MLASSGYDTLELTLYIAFSNSSCVLYHMVIILTAYYAEVVKVWTKQRTLILIFLPSPQRASFYMEVVMYQLDFQVSKQWSLTLVG